MKEPRLIANLRGWALFFGSGGVGALQIMKWELFNFPDPVRIWLVYFFSIVTVFSVFLGAHELIARSMAGIDELRRLKDIKNREQKKNDQENEPNQ